MSNEFPSRLSFAGAVRPGNTIEARWIIGHPMDSGMRVDDSGKRIFRNIIDRVRVRMNDELVLEMEPGTGLSANPYFAFPLTVPAGGGMLTIEWRDDHGRSGRVQQALPLER